MVGFGGGLRIIESPYLTEPGEPIEVRRSWRERLFSRPWLPLMATRRVIPQVPKKGGIVSGGCLFVHPETARMLRSHGCSMCAEVHFTPAMVCGCLCHRRRS